MIILSGKIIQEKIKSDLMSAILRLETKPHLAIVQVGNNPESDIYIKQKKKFGESIGAQVSHVVFPESVTEEELMEKIKHVSLDTNIHGIIVQLPLPSHIESQKILNSIAPEKDVDGLGIVQQGRLYANQKNTLVPATARGIMTLLQYYDISLASKHVVVVGRSNLVGKPTALSSLHRNATVTVCHSHTKNSADITRTADVLIVAAGKLGLITVDHVREGQVVVDVGIHRTEEGLKGDVDFESVQNTISAITPVPGGVGPLTVASLFQNLLDAYILQEV